ncbi:MAG: elongation factor P, partial [Candidatus Omnitrophota bacterium]|nr:elongation factor P [Candidatus Omnitrophota bacterium]
MDNETYEQIFLPEERIGAAKKFLKENTEVIASAHDGNIINIKLPAFVNIRVSETEPGIRGDTAKAGSKIAKLETGAAIQVPLFINTGDMITMDTRTAKYAGRA